jgi:hypothetical protein
MALPVIVRETQTGLEEEIVEAFRTRDEAMAFSC